LGPSSANPAVAVNLIGQTCHVGFQPGSSGSSGTLTILDPVQGDTVRLSPLPAGYVYWRVMPKPPPSSPPPPTPPAPPGSPTMWAQNTGAGVPAGGGFTATMVGNTGPVQTTTPVNSGKHYLELRIDVPGQDWMLSMCSGTSPLAGWWWTGSSVSMWGQASYNRAYGTAADFLTGNHVGYAFDADAGVLNMYVNGVDRGILFGPAGVNPAGVETLVGSTYQPCFQPAGGSSSGTLTILDPTRGDTIRTNPLPAGFSYWRDLPPS